MLRRPLEPGQYTSYAFGQVLDDHRVLGSIGSVGDAYDNSMAESFVDTFKTELIKDRVWRTRTQLELAIVEYVGWFNQARLHESLGDRPPAEIEALYAAQTETTITIYCKSRWETTKSGLRRNQPGSNYLQALGAPDYTQALFGYNHAAWYVAEVLAQARDYGYTGDGTHNGPHVETSSDGGRSSGAGPTPVTDNDAGGDGGGFDTKAATDFARGRHGSVSFALADSEGEIVASFHGDEHTHSASLTKAMILVARLRDLNDRDVPADEQPLMAAMIRRSDNAAANALYARTGRDGVLPVAQAAGMRSFELRTTDPAYRLGDSLITAADQARFFARLDNLIPAHHRAYARTLLSTLQEGHWGLLDAGLPGTVLSKAGWRPEDDGTWTVTQAAQFGNADNPSGLAVLTEGNPDETYGHASITGVATTLNPSAEDGGCGGAIGGRGPAALVAAANELAAMHLPYCYGGGHVTPAKPNHVGCHTSRAGMDCSATVSWVLQHAGYKLDTMDTAGLIKWAEPGRGADGVTLWNKPYGAQAHIILQIGKRFFGTSGAFHPAAGTGAAWFTSTPGAGYLAGFQATHIPASADGGKEKS